MALRALGLDPAAHPPTVTGGLSFFGGPLNNYMTHATCAMVRALRAAPGELGLLYGQGGYVNKHQSLVVSTAAAPAPLALDFSLQAEADGARGAVPPLAEAYAGPATVETYTITFDRKGDAAEGIVILRTPDGGRTMARVPVEDAESLDLLRATERSAIGAAGVVRLDTFGKPVWEARPAPAPRPPRFTRVERDGPITLITIDRPDAMNALHPAANAELAEAFDAFEKDPDQWVAILTGAGERAFCVGNDLKYTAGAMARGLPLEVPVSGFAGLTGRFDMTKPVIAAVNGAALGGGFEIALACDLIIASTAAQFALPEPKVGLAALAGGLLRLPRQIGLKPAMGLILTGRSVSAEEGLRLGFVNAVTTPEDLLAEANRWASAICALSPMSVRASKQVVHRGLADPSIASTYASQM
ncbi:MAG: enoyl-CoA hydratase, partial [Caulobacter sp. 12-67-6]